MAEVRRSKTKKMAEVHETIPPNGRLIYNETVFTAGGKKKEISIDFEDSLHLLDNKFHVEDEDYVRRKNAICEIKQLLKLIEAYKCEEGKERSFISFFMSPDDELFKVDELLEDRVKESEYKAMYPYAEGAITSAQQILKQYSKVPPNGFALYTGTVFIDDSRQKDITIKFEPLKLIYRATRRIIDWFDIMDRMLGPQFQNPQNQQVLQAHPQQYPLSVQPLSESVTTFQVPVWFAQPPFPLRPLEPPMRVPSQGQAPELPPALVIHEVQPRMPHQYVQLPQVSVGYTSGPVQGQSPQVSSGGPPQLLQQPPLGYFQPYYLQPYIAYYQYGSESSDILRKTKSMSWCRVCKVDCGSVEGLGKHCQTCEHQHITMDMVRKIKQKFAQIAKATS